MCAALGFCCSGVRAQDTWQLMRGWDVDRVLYKYTALAACDDHDFSSAAIICDSATKLYSYVVVRTSNGGLNWSIQHLPLPETTSQLMNVDFTYTSVRKIDQIDSLRAVAVGDSGWVVRTSDAGVTWTRINFPLARVLADVSFASDGSGILCGGSVVAVSFDWGETWKVAPFGNSHAMASCHAYGGGRFRAYANGNGPLYTSIDGGLTADSLLIFPSDSLDTRVVAALEYQGFDTLIGVGRNDGTSLLHTNCFVTVSTDGGHAWRTLLDRFCRYSPNGLNSLSTMSQALWVAGGGGDGIVFSRDHGSTWTNDSVLLAPPLEQQFLSLTPLLAISNSKLIGVVHGLSYQGGGGLVSINTAMLHVERYEYQVFGTHVYPNPASGLVNIVSNYASLSPITLVNVLGLETYEGMLDGSGALQFDVSRLVAGVYQVVMNYNGVPLHITNLVILPK